MRHKPWIIKIMTGSLLLVPVTAAGLVVFARHRHGGHPLTTNILMDLWVLVIASLIAAFGVWRVRPWGFFLFFLFMFGVLSFDIHHIVKNPATFNFWDLVDVSMIAMGVIFILQKHVSAPYFNPKIRWWERPARHKVDLKANIVMEGKQVVSQLLDLSSSGCFMDTEAPLAPGEVAAIDLTFKEFKFESPVRVIRLSQKPKGVGLMFVNSTPENKREIKRIIKDLKRGLKVRDSSPSQTAMA